MTRSSDIENGNKFRFFLWRRKKGSDVKAKGKEKFLCENYRVENSRKRVRKILSFSTRILSERTERISI